MAEMKYGTVTSDRRTFHPGEPVFIVRAQDRLAPELLRRYYTLCLAAGCDDSHLSAIDDVRRSFTAWQAEHPDLVKIPD
jgi:hypothetical protein